jgi:hypothetical protein
MRWPIGLFVLTYVAAMVGIVVLAWQTRQSVLAQLDNPAARAQWQEWKQDEEARAAAKKDSSAARRPPKSPEPPAVILLRDHFGAILASALVTGSALFAVLYFLLRGALVSKPRPVSTADEKVCPAAASENKMV